MKTKTISKMTGTRGVMPPPSSKVSNKKGKGSYNRKQGKRVEY